MVSPEAKRAAVAQMRQVHGTSERRACGLIDQARSTQRYAAKPKPDGFNIGVNGWSGCQNTGSQAKIVSLVVAAAPYMAVPWPASFMEDAPGSVLSARSK